MDFLNLLAIKDMGHGLVIGLLVMVASPIKLQLGFLRTLPFLSTLCFVLALSLGVGYLIYPNYFDHAEPTIAIIGQIVASGGQAYPEGVEWQFNGLIYGPSLYLLNALGTQLFDPILGSKLPGVLSYVMGLSLLWWLLPSWFARAMMVLIYLFYEFGFWNRPEAHLLFLTTLGIVLIENEKQRNSTLLGLGLLAGVATTFKFTGFLFFAPLVFVTLMRTNSWRQLPLAVFLGIGVASLPYALPVFSIDNHFAYIQLLATQTLSSGLMQSNIAYAAFSIFPVIWLWSSQRNHPEFRQLGMIILVDVFIELLVCIAASKPGAGPHHLLPGLPIKIWLVHQLTYKNKDFSARAYRFLGLVFFVMSIYFISYGYPKFLRVHLVSLDSYWRQVEAKQELIELVKKYPSPLIGVSDDKHENYSLSFYRPYAFGLGYKDKLDPVAFMEINYTLEVDDSLFAEKIQTCTYKSIILPIQGRPFDLSNLYFKYKKPLFTDNLRLIFSSSYKLLHSGRFYKVFECSRVL